MRLSESAHYPGSMHNKPVSSPIRRRMHDLRPLLTLAAALLLAACGHAPVKNNAGHARPAESWPTVAPSNPAAANAVLMRALGLVGTPYLYGGNTPESGFDCSGLVAYVYRDVLDLRLPRSSRELAQVQGPRIDPGRLAAGDLVFFGSRGNVSHVGIYVGEGRFVHAPSSGGTVRLDSLGGPYWQDHYTGARRVLN
ncbi:C40 family peptidase [Stenotrophomonas sp. MMGLT7]|uniref:C40 family peptidase n=1 Tax=Stenotrophomonas sp. MMGLT7 TaxID=2901227 RepID=UPI002F90D9D7